MDILRVLSSPDLEVRKKSLELVVDLMTSRNCEEVSTAFACMRNFSKFLIKFVLFQVRIFWHKL